MLGAVTMLLVVVAALPLAATAATYAMARRRGETGTEPLGIGERLGGVLRETGAALAVAAGLPLRLRPQRPRGASRGVVLLIPRFLILSELGLYDSYAGMIIPLLSTAAGVFIMKQFFDSIPESIEEAARIDGAGVFRRFWSVVLPMATPALVTIFILSFQGSWNELGHFIVARQSPELNTLTVGVAQLVSGQLGAGNQYPLQLAAAVLMSIPVVVLSSMDLSHEDRERLNGRVLQFVQKGSTSRDELLNTLRHLIAGTARRK